MKFHELLPRNLIQYKISKYFSSKNNNFKNKHGPIVKNYSFIYTEISFSTKLSISQIKEKLHLQGMQVATSILLCLSSYLQNKQTKTNSEEIVHIS